METKFCKDCAHFRKFTHGEWWVCVRRVVGISMVTGDKIYRDCESERHGELGQGYCGEAAAYFVALPEKPF